VPSAGTARLRNFYADLPVMDSAIATIPRLSDLPRRQLRRPRRQGQLGVTLRLCCGTSRVDPFAADNFRMSPTRCGRSPRPAAPRGADRSGSRVLALAASADSLRFTRCTGWPSPCLRTNPAGLWWRPCFNTTPSRSSFASAIAGAWAGDHKPAPDLSARACAARLPQLNASTFSALLGLHRAPIRYDSLISASPR